MYADMIFKFGYVHCDPHPGNVLVRKDTATGRPQIVLLDHGLYTVSFVETLFWLPEKDTGLTNSRQPAKA